MNAFDLIRDELTRAATAVGAPSSVEPVLERPRDPSFGDWTTNLAMTLAKPLGRKPRDLAVALIGAMDFARAGVMEAEIAGPGFINFRLDPAAAAGALAAVLAAGTSYGHGSSRNGSRAIVEFVSANPTGPLHVGHGRQAALGDAISSLMESQGYSVSREFYYNDAGTQIENLGLSVRARLSELRAEREERPELRVELPEGGYRGEYVREIALRYAAEHADDDAGDDLTRVTAFAVRALRHEQDLDLQAFGVRFDSYFLESSLYEDGRVERTVEALRASGRTYDKDGALWLRTTDYGDDQDRVMRKSAEKGGTFTYFVPDVAYHVTKWERGFPRAINVQGGDHHGTVARVRAGLQALGIGVPEGYPEYVLHQMVTVTRAGEEVKISKRAGSYVTVRDLIDEVGRDAVRYFFLMRKGDSQLVFDVDLARSQSEENPVYYVQMAHARMSGIFRVGGIDAADIEAGAAQVDYSLLSAPAERELIKALLDYPALVASATEALEPHRLAAWLLETARLAHLWYHKHHVLGEPEPVTTARLALARATQVVLRNGLGLLGISAPERM